MKYVIEIEMDNEAFDPEHGNDEIKRQLFKIIAQILNNNTTPPLMHLRDINGNACGETRIEND